MKEPKPFYWIQNIGKPSARFSQSLENPSDVKEDRPMLTRLEEKTGRKGKALYAPLRAAVTGKIKGPELVKTPPAPWEGKNHSAIKDGTCNFLSKS